MQREESISNGSVEQPPLKMTGPSHRHSSMSSQSSTRFETFTEAVPLSLSSMAHASLPLEEGVLDGVRQVISHTMLSCVNYARIVHPPHQWTFRDLCTSEFSWLPVKSDCPPRDLPLALQRLKFQHKYTKSAWIYLKPALPPKLTQGEELQNMRDWPQQIGILGCVKLHYTSTEALTAGELNGTDVEDIPPTILYKVVVEYRSLPPTGNQQAVQAEELSMLSFGGSVDDDVKYGALASLYDESAKYVLEIYSVRGKKYKFDLMDATLSNGTVPRLPSTTEQDPFVKCLCVTVTDHASMLQQEDQKYAITRIHLTLEGKMRRPLNELPSMDYMPRSIAMSFRCLNPHESLTATALPSGHTLLLDKNLAGHVYVNGRYIATWGKDTRIGSHGIALFGMDLHSVPVWHGRIVDFEALKSAYGQLWHEILVDARLFDLKIASRLINRLMTGKDGIDEEDDEDGGYDDDDKAVDVNIDCLETQCLATPKYDVVGIAAKALATRFAMQFGKDAFPCESYEVEWVRTMLPNKDPIIVPYRLIAILRRGGYFDVQRTHDEYTWFAEFRPPVEVAERELIAAAIHLLEKAGCEDISFEQIGFSTLTGQLPQNVIADKAVCRYNEVRQQYCVNEKFLNASLLESTLKVGADLNETHELKAYFLGMYMAQAHPDGTLLPRYLLRNQQPS
ncbi:hypothetical protein ACA910_015163 [Epithemia clementina (nom. ined.)]